MELHRVNTKQQKVVIAPLGDIQYSGKGGPLAKESLKRHIDRALTLDAWFIGMGDYIDFLSPSNRARLQSAGLYDTARAVINDKARELVQELFDDFLEPTKGRWLGLLEGHHLFEGTFLKDEDHPDDGDTSDQWLAGMLGTTFLGTSAYVRLEPCNVVVYAHHGLGGGILPTSGINKLYHLSAGLYGADVYLMGHNTKEGTMRLSRPFPDWNRAQPDLTHNDVLLVNTGGFSRSNIVGHKQGRIPRGDYAEQGMMTPSPLSAPIIYINGKEKGPGRVRVEI